MQIFQKEGHLLTKNDGMTISLEGIRELMGKKLFNKNLEEALDLWMLSFFLSGMDIREILIAKKDEVMPGIFLAHKTKETTIPLPLSEKAFEIFEKYSGKYYALKFIESTGIPRTKLANEKANRIKFDLNRRMETISKYLGLKNILLFENIHVMWSLLAREQGMEKKIIDLMSEFIKNTKNRKLKEEQLEMIGDAFFVFYDHLHEVVEEPAPVGESYPKELPDGSILLYEF